MKLPQIVPNYSGIWNEYEQNLFAFWDVKPRSCFDHFCCNIIHALLPPSNPLPPALPTLLASHWHHCRLQQYSHSRLRPLDNFEPRGSSTWPHQAGEQGNMGKLFGHGGRSTTAGYNFLDLGVLNRGGVYQYWFKIQPTNGRDLKLVVGNAMQRDMADGIITTTTTWRNSKPAPLTLQLRNNKPSAHIVGFAVCNDNNSLKREMWQ